MRTDDSVTSGSDSSISDHEDNNLYPVGEEDNLEDQEHEDDLESTGEWVPVDDVPIVINIDGIDQKLIELARKEVPIVLDRIHKKMYGNSAVAKDIPLTNASPKDFLKLFLNSEMMRFICGVINKSLDPPIIENELFSFLQVELSLSFYKCSPTRYFNPEYRFMFPGVEEGMQQDRYSSILKALSKMQQPNVDIDFWEPVMSHDKELSKAMDNFRTNCAEIGFVEGLSRIGIDDDHLRLRSKKVKQYGLSQSSNPKKGLAVVHHGAVSVCTGLCKRSHHFCW
jgi:Transposase IS4